MMAHKRLSRKPMSLKERGRRGLSLFLAMVMTLSLVQIGAFADGYSSEDQIVKNNQSETLYYVYDEDSEQFTTTTTDPVITNTGNDNWRVKMSKTIQPTDTENQFVINLAVDTKQQIEVSSSMPDAAVVLVIDCSTSMNENYSGNSWSRVSKLEAAKEAAISFAKKFAESGIDPKTGAPIAARYISLVSFNKTASTHSIDGDIWVDAATLDWNSSYENSLERIINGLNTDTWTNISGGLSLASDHLNYVPKVQNDQGQQVDIENTYVLLLGDGKPQKQFRDDYTASPSGYGDSGSYTGKDWDGYYQTENWAHYIREKQEAKLFSVYVEKGATDSNSTYLWFSNFSNNCSLANGSDSLVETFEKYTTLIAMGTKAWRVTDPMGACIEYVRDSTLGDYINDVTPPAGGEPLVWNLTQSLPKVYDSTGNELTNIKDLDDLKDLAKDGSFTFKYRFSYTIKLNPTSSYSQGLTNGRTILQYYLTDTEDNFVDDEGNLITDPEQALLTKDFHVPAVKINPVSFTIDKYAAYNDELIKTYTKEDAFRLTREDDSSIYYEADAKAGLIDFTNIPSGFTYTLTEENAPDGYLKGEDVTVTISAGQISFSPRLDSISTGHYKYTNDLDPQYTTLNFEKIWAGNDAPAGASITINVDATYKGEYADENASEFDRTVNLSADNGWETSIYVPTIDVDNGYGIAYTATEATGDGYQQLTATGGTVTEGSDGIDDYSTFVFTNARTQGVTVKKVWVDDQTSHDGISVTVYNSADPDNTIYQKTVTLSGTGSEWSQDVNVPKYTADGSVITYSAYETINGKAYYNGDTVEINGVAYTVSVNGTTITNSRTGPPSG